MIEVGPGFLDDRVGIRNVSNRCRLVVLCATFLLYSTYVLADLPHLQKVMDPGRSVQFSFLCVILQFQVRFSFRSIQYCTITRQYSDIIPSILPSYDFFPHCLASGFRLSPPNHISHKKTTGLHSDSLGHNTEYVPSHIEGIGVL